MEVPHEEQPWAHSRTQSGAQLDHLKTQAIHAVDSLREDIVQASSAIHANPETAFEEIATSQLLVNWLASAGFQLEVGVAEMPTAFKASFSFAKPGPVIALLAEYDALPDLGHACGHNIIAAASVGAAVAVSTLASELKDELCGTVLAIGTPAEEYGGGKIRMVEQGVFDGIDAAMIVHPNTTTCVHMYALANETIEAEYFGEAAHAAAYPHRGINALDAIVTAYNNIGVLRQQMRPDARVHGIITNGGQASNIIPAYAAGRFQVRAQDDAYLDILMQQVLNCLRAGALATGARFEHHSLEGRYQTMLNNETLAQAFAGNLNALGLSTEEYDHAKGYGSTDVGNVSHVVPCIHPTIAIADKSVALHSPDFARAAVSARGEAGLIDAAKALAMTTVELLVDPQLMTGVKREFTASV